VVVAESGASLSGSIISLKILGNANFLQSAQWPAAAPSGNLIFRPRCQCALLVQCCVNFIITLHYAARALSSRRNRASPARSRTISRAYMKRLYIIKKRPERARLVSPPSALRGARSRRDYLMILHEKLPSICLQSDAEKSTLLLCFEFLSLIQNSKC
jgi:hypothetical protein